MSWLIPNGEMSADQIIQCGYDAMAIVSLCAHVARNFVSEAPGGATTGDIAIALELAEDLIAVMHESLEIHEGVIAEGRRARR